MSHLSYTLTTQQTSSELCINSFTNGLTAPDFTTASILSLHMYINPQHPSFKTASSVDFINIVNRGKHSFTLLKSSVYWHKLDNNHVPVLINDWADAVPHFALSNSFSNGGKAPFKLCRQKCVRTRQHNSEESSPGEP